MVATHALQLTSLWSNHHRWKSLIAPSDMLHLIFGTSFLHHSEFLMRITHPLSETIIWTCRFNLLHSAITFDYFFAVSLWAQNLPFQKILFSTLVCSCLSEWSHGSRPFTGLIGSSILRFSFYFLLILVIRHVWLTKLARSLVSGQRFGASNLILVSISFCLVCLYGFVASVLGRWTCHWRSDHNGINPSRCTVEYHLGQVVHIHLPLSSSVIIRYHRKLREGRGKQAHRATH